MKAVPPFVLDPVLSEEGLDKEGRWMTNMIKCWLDEEWTALEVHAALSRAAGEVCDLLWMSHSPSSTALLSLCTARETCAQGMLSQRGTQTLSLSLAI